jgi:GrpB-like predicted nucleotidyltransferase (UPF0157 family)
VLPIRATSSVHFTNTPPDWHQHRLFKGPDTDINLYVFSDGCPEIERMLLFRDWLRSNADDRELYARTERELAQRTWKYT